MAAAGRQRSDLAIVVADDDEGLTDDVQTDVVAGVGDLLFPGGYQPPLEENRFNLPVVPFLGEVDLRRQR